MPHKTMSLALQNDNQITPESVPLRVASTWDSPLGGWQSVQSGAWDQSPAGVGLNRTGEHGGNVATLKGLNFYLNAVGDKGAALYPDSGDMGTWQVAAVTNS